MSEKQINQRVADEICRDSEYGGTRFAIGQCVALLDGRVVGRGYTLDEVYKQLRSIEPNPRRGMLVEVGPPVVDVIR